jgi:quinol-cytochrome oxidoreductase complex cytochrome b subunit
MGVDYREQYKPEHLEPFFPNEIVKMIIVVLCTLALLTFLAVLPVCLEHLGVEGFAHEQQPADPASTPPHIRPEWYFLAVYQYLKLMPSEVLGISGKALGILTQMVVVGLLFLFPFWCPLRSAQVDRDEWRTGLLTLLVHWLAFAVPAGVLLWVRSRMAVPYGDIVHPMYVWPVLWIFGYIGAGLLMKRAGLSDAFRWLLLLNTGVILTGFQGLTFLVVLGQGLSWAIDPAIAYAVGLVLFVISTIVIVWFLIRRMAGNDGRLRVRLMAGLTTEGLALFLGLTIWAMWPPGGLFAGGPHDETRRFLFTVFLMALAVTVFYAFLITEWRTVHRTLSPEERDQLP